MTAPRTGPATRAGVAVAPGASPRELVERAEQLLAQTRTGMAAAASLASGISDAVVSVVRVARRVEPMTLFSDLLWEDLAEQTGQCRTATMELLIQLRAARVAATNASTLLRCIDRTRSEPGVGDRVVSDLSTSATTLAGQLERAAGFVERAVGRLTQAQLACETRDWVSARLKAPMLETSASDLADMAAYLSVATPLQRTIPSKNPTNLPEGDTE